jgi:hypothetical protein
VSARTARNDSVAAESLDYSLPDPELKLVRIDSAAVARFGDRQNATKAIQIGRMELLFPAIVRFAAMRTSLRRKRHGQII